MVKATPRERLVSHFLTAFLVLLWFTLFERFVILPRSKERYEQAARELEAGFRARGWQLEFVAKDFDSPMKVVAYFQLTPVLPSSNSSSNNNHGDVIKYNEEEDENEEAWVLASSVDPHGIGWLLRPKAPSLLDGVPVSMKLSVDVFLWGPLTEACVKARMKHTSDSCCWAIGAYFLSTIALVFAFVAIFVLLYFISIEGEEATDFIYYGGMVIAIFIGYFYLLYAMLSITEAMVAKKSFHPEMSAIVKEFEPKFEDAGFRMEYITEDQEIPLEYKRKGSCKSGHGFLRFVSVTKQDYVKISDTAVNNGWVV